MGQETRFSFFGDRGVVISLGEEPNETNCKKAISFSRGIEKEEISGIIDAQISYNTIVIHYNPLRIDIKFLLKELRRIEKSIKQITFPPRKVYDLPTLYGGEYGPDLQYVAEYNGITAEEVIRIHTRDPLFVYRMGLNVQNLVPKEIITPRKKIPRLSVPASSVGIGNRQTGPYVIDAPGGWNIIGMTPVEIYDPKRNPPFLFEIGDYVHYRAITEDEFKSIKSDRFFVPRIKSL